MKIKYEVIVTGGSVQMQDFDNITSAIDYAARHVYLPWDASLKGIELLKKHKEFSYSYGFNEAHIIPKIETIE